MDKMEGVETVSERKSEVSREILIKVSEHAGVKGEFRRLSRHLGVKDETLVEIEHIYLLPLNDKCYRVLQSWQYEKGSQATLAALLKVLQNLGFNDIAEQCGAPSAMDEDRGAVSQITQGGDRTTESRDKFIGREKEIKLILDKWKDTRIFGIFGFSGMGKSRLARQAIILLKQSRIPKQIIVHQYLIDLRGIKSSGDLKLRFLSMMGLDTAAASYVLEINTRIRKSNDYHIFIIDNAEDVDENHDLKNEFLSNCEMIMQDNEKLTMFITSKVQLQTSEPFMQAIDLPPLSTSEAKMLLKVTSPETDFGKWKEKIVELCGGNPQLLKLAASAISTDKMISVEDYVKALESDRLKTMDDEAYSTHRRTEGMVNIFLSRMPKEQKTSMEELNYMFNTFSRHAAAAILDEEDYSKAYLNTLRNLHYRHVLEVAEYDDEKRLYIHDIVKDWVEKNTDMTGERLQEIRRRFVLFFSDVIENINAMMQSVESAKAIRSLGFEILNLKKLLTDSAFVDENTYNALKNVALRNRELIEKYMPELALHFFENMHTASTQRHDEYGIGVMASRIGSVYTNVNSKLPDGFEWYEKAEEGLVKGGASTELAMLYQHKGWNFYLQANKTAAIQYLEKAHEMFKTLGQGESRLAMMNYASMGVVYTFHGDLDRGRDFHKKSIQLCEKLMGRQYSLGSYYNNLGINYNLRGDLDNALTYSEIGLQIKRDFVVGPEKSVVLSLNNVAMLHVSARNNTDQALVYLNEAVQMKDKLPFSPLVEALTMDNFCQVYNKRGEFEKAIPYGKAAAKVNREHKPRHVMFAESALNCAIALHGAGRHDEAYTRLQEALAIKEQVLEQMPKRYYVFETYKMLTKVTKASGKSDEARAYFSRAMEELQRLHDLHSKEENMKDLEKINEEMSGMRAEMQG